MASTLDLGNLLVHLRMESAQFNSSITSMVAKMRSVSNTMSSIGRQMSMYITAPIIGAFTFATKQMISQEKATEALNAALSQSGIVSKAVTGRFEEFASEMQRLTVYSDDLVLSQMAYGKNLGIEVSRLEEVTRAAAGLGAKYRRDLPEAMMLLGRASQGSTAMLSRMGIVLDENLTKEQKFAAVIKKGLEGWDIAVAQTKTMAGSLSQLKNAVSDAGESLGIQLYPYINKVTVGIRELLDWWGKLGVEVKQSVVYWGLIAAAIGPILIANSLLIKLFTDLILVLQGLTVGFATLVSAMFGPLGVILLLAGAAYVVRAAWYQNIEAIKNRMQEFADTFGDVYTVAAYYTNKFLDWYARNFSTMFAKVKQAAKDFVLDYTATVAGVTAWIGSLGKISFAEAYVSEREKIEQDMGKIIPYISEKFEVTSIALEAFSKATVESLSDLMDAVKVQFGKDADAIIKLIQDKMESLKMLTGEKEGLLWQQQFETFYPEDLPSMTGKSTKEISEGVKQMQKMLRSLDNEYKLLGKINDERQRATALAEFQSIAEEEIRRNVESTAKVLEMYRQYEQRLNDLMKGRRGVSAMTVQLEQWANDATNIFQNLGEVMVRAFDNASASLTQMIMEGKASFHDFARAVIADILQMMIRYQMASAMQGLFPNWFGAPATATANTSVSAVLATGPHVMHSGGVVPYDGIPRLHGGLASDEYPAILQRGETVIPAGRGMSPPSVVINNNTGQPLKQKGQPRYDGNQWIVDLVVDSVARNIDQNGILRGKIQGVSRG